MRAALLALLLLAAPAVAQFVPAGQMWFRADSPERHGVLTVNADNWTEDAWPPGVWHRITVPALPENTCAAALGGKLIITQSSYVQYLCNIQVYVRGVGQTHEPSDLWQCIEASWAAGQRSPLFAIVPITARSFELKWIRSPGDRASTWPQTPAFALNLWLNAYWLAP